MARSFLLLVWCSTLVCLQRAAGFSDLLDMISGQDLRDADTQMVKDDEGKNIWNNETANYNQTLKQSEESPEETSEQNQWREATERGTEADQWREATEIGTEADQWREATERRTEVDQRNPREYKSPENHLREPRALNRWEDPVIRTLYQNNQLLQNLRRSHLLTTVQLLNINSCLAGVQQSILTLQMRNRGPDVSELFAEIATMKYRLELLESRVLAPPPAAPSTGSMTTPAASTTGYITSPSAGINGQSCQDRCGVNDGVSACQCNALCTDFGDCCDDFVGICMSCQDRCGEAYLYSKPCQCNSECGSHGNCCTDYNDLCGGTGGSVTDTQLRDLTEQLFAAEVNAVGDQLTLDLQGQGSSGDLAPGPLFTSVPPSALSGPTMSLLVQLQDNYIPDVTNAEVEDAGELAEQQAFLDAIMATEIMTLAETFLTDNALLTGTLRDKVEEIWFTMYTRSGSILGSSGFEHVMVGELKNSAVSGFHNWVNFQDEEQEGNLNYEGYSKIVDLGTKGDIIMHHFTWLTEPKSIGSMFIGTSPELELATYTVCFLARPDSLCPVQMNGYQFQVQTWTLAYNGKTLVGSAYPDI